MHVNVKEQLLLKTNATKWPNLSADARPSLTATLTSLIFEVAKVATPCQPGTLLASLETFLSAPEFYSWPYFAFSY